MPSDPLDRFYTKPEMARKCIDRLKLLYSAFDFDLIVDPCAGEGAFVNALGWVRNLAVMDIDPDVPYPNKDFLEYSPPTHLKKILTVGNPPFGQAPYFVKARAFIEHAAEFSRVIAFILPRGWMSCVKFGKLSVVDSMHLPMNSFTHFGQEVEVATSFVIFESF